MDEWAATDHLPARKLDSSSSTRRTITGIALRPGDEIRIEGTPEGRELAALDYLEILPSLCRFKNKEFQVPVASPRAGASRGHGLARPSEMAISPPV